MSAQRKPSNDQSDITTVAPTADHEEADHGKARPQPDKATRQSQPTITTGNHTQQGRSDVKQLQEAHRKESLPVNDLDLNEQGDEALHGDERGGD